MAQSSGLSHSQHASEASSPLQDPSRLSGEAAAKYQAWKNSVLLPSSSPIAGSTSDAFTPGMRESNSPSDPGTMHLVSQENDPVTRAQWYLQEYLIKYSEILSELAPEKKWETANWREPSIAVKYAQSKAERLAGKTVAELLMKGEGDPLSDLFLIRKDEKDLSLLESRGIMVRPKPLGRLVVPHSPAHVR